MTTRSDAARARAEAVGRSLADRPKERRLSEDGPIAPRTRAALTLRAAGTLERDGLTVAHIGGHASTTEDPYEMYDMFGPYTEIVTAGAFEKTLGAGPLVEFTVNHGHGGGLPMAHTRNSTLDLAEDETGLNYDAFVDPERADVAILLAALERGDMAEASFKFRITSGMWSPDYTEFRINEVDLDGGDVSAVNFGANPAATSGLRAATEPVVERDTTHLRALIAAGLSE